MALTDQQDYVYWIERDGIGIAKYDSSENVDNRFTGPAASKTITIFATKYADDFTTTLSASSEIPSEFHDALVYKVCSRLYEGDIETLKLAEHFRDKCMRIVREAKQYVKSNKTQGGYIKPQYF